MAREYWGSTLSHVLAFEADKTTYNVFGGDSDSASSENTRVDETELVDFLVKNHKREICNLVGCNEKFALLKSGVVEPFTTKDSVPGDIDIIIFDTRNPEITIAIEVKVLRKDQNHQEDGYLEGFKRLKKGSNQAKALSEKGFAQVYLMTIILANVSNQQEINEPNRGIELRNWSRVRAHIKSLILNHIGILEMDFDQITAKNIFVKNHLCFNKHKGSSQNQADWITMESEKIIESYKRP